jgi:IS30 family transposase
MQHLLLALDRAPSTVSHQLKRNSGRQLGYRPGHAEEQTRARRFSTAARG